MKSWLFCIVIALGWSALVAQAKQDVSVPATRPAASLPQIRGWFADLAHRDSDVRESARAALMDLSLDDLPSLKQVVEESRPLQPSQAAVLKSIVTQIFLAGHSEPADASHGFLGVSLGEGSVLVGRDKSAHGEFQHGIVILDRMAGFAGFRSLLDGDVILSIREQPQVVFTSSRDISQAIQSIRAGEIVHLEVLRQGQVSIIPVRLDARPLRIDGAEPDPEEARRMRVERDNSAEEYWEQNFAKLLGEGKG